MMTWRRRRRGSKDLEEDSEDVDSEGDRKCSDGSISSYTLHQESLEKS
jgi:hypothetical protein